MTPVNHHSLSFNSWGYFYEEMPPRIHSAATPRHRPRWNVSYGFSRCQHESPASSGGEQWRLFLLTPPFMNHYLNIWHVQISSHKHQTWLTDFKLKFYARWWLGRCLPSPVTVVKGIVSVRPLTCLSNKRKKCVRETLVSPASSSVPISSREALSGAWHGAFRASPLFGLSVSLCTYRLSPSPSKTKLICFSTLHSKIKCICDLLF